MLRFALPPVGRSIRDIGTYVSCKNGIHAKAGAMIFDWFQSKYARDKDRIETASIRRTYGDTAKCVIRDRMNNTALSARDREHWKRIARKLKCW
jgi:hypothetical protein